MNSPIPDIHEKSIIIDGLIISNFSRRVFEDMKAGGITAANCTCSIWDGFAETAQSVARWKRMIRENSDLLTQIHTVDDIRKAKEHGKVGIILGWQNATGYGDNLDNVGFFADLGVKIVQLTYNTATSIGTGCYESRDGGLTDFGHEVVAEMNACGVLIDLSHVGPNTSRDAIVASRSPVAYTHCCPAGLMNHPRNKSDEQLKFIADHGGFVGVTTFPSFLAGGVHSTVKDYVDALEYVMNLVGEESVGIGTDLTQDQPTEFFDWITHDKGHARQLVSFGEALELGGFTRLSEFPNITREMKRRHWSDSRIERMLGNNWMTFLERAWTPVGDMAPNRKPLQA